ncbi:esterase-like activity of phytase family protein [Streptomyces sp. NPDC002643]
MRLRTVLATLTAGLAAATTTLSAVSPATANSLTHNACSRSVSITGYSDALDKTTYDGTFVGNFSALATDRDGSLLALSDRSSLFTLDAGTLRPKGVLPLTTETGTALDSEGLAVDTDETRLITSETEPSVRRYDRTGRILSALPVPDALKVAPAGRATTNQTFEGLTLLPGGHTLLATMEGSLSGDSTGTLRFQTWQRKATGGTREFKLAAQYGYRADTGLGVVEATGLPGGRLLILERGFTSGVGNTVRLYLADTRRATDTTAVEALPGQDDADVRLIHKTLLADIASCPSLGATAKQPQPNPLLDNIEAMTITGHHRGHLNVLLASDDNQNAVQITRFYRLRVRV